LKILGLETSSTLFSVCLNNDARLICEIRKDRDAQHGPRDGDVFREVQGLLKQLHGEPLGAVVISIGPGMFTSLRVGLSLAKGIAFAQNVPIVGVNTLDIIGMSSLFFNKVLLAVINAFQGEIYAAFYKKGKPISDYMLTTPNKLQALSKKHRSAAEGTLIAGPGVSALKNIPAGSISYLQSDFFLPSAAKAVLLALPRIKKSNFDDPEFLEPFYLKKTDAERKDG